MRKVNNLLHVAQILWTALICLAQKVFMSSLRDLKLSREKGFDRHTASAYLIALKGLGTLNNIK